MDSAVRRTLSVPIRKLGGCVVGMKEKGDVVRRRRTRRSRGGGGGERRGAIRRCPARRTSSKLRKQPTVIYSYSYQAELEKERKLREDMNVRKNAERAAMRCHFRRKYQLDKNQKDTEHLRSVGGRVTLPRELSKLVRPKSQSEDKVFGLLSAFQSLSFKTAAPTPTRIPLEPCKVM